jgi:hypothetical protein
MLVAGTIPLLLVVSRVIANTATIVTTTVTAIVIATIIVDAMVAMLLACIVVVAATIVVAIALRFTATAHLLSLPVAAVTTARTVPRMMPWSSRGVAVAMEARSASATGVQDLQIFLGLCLLLGELQPGLGLHEGGEWLR